MAAWKGRSDLEKEMRKANDRLRALEAHGETSVPAYKEAIRLMRNATGDPNERVPRFRRSDYKSEAELRKAIKKFTGAKTSTVRGVNTMVRKQQQAYSRSAGRPITRSEAKAIGNIWEGIRKSSAKYDSAKDTETQRLIERGLERGMDEDGIADILEDIRADGTPIDEWEEVFDAVLDDILGDEDEGDGGDEDEED